MENNASKEDVRVDTYNPMMISRDRAVILPSVRAFCLKIGILVWSDGVPEAGTEFT